MTKILLSFAYLGYLGYVCMFLHITYCIASVHMCFSQEFFGPEEKTQGSSA